MKLLVVVVAVCACAAFFAVGSAEAASRTAADRAVPSLTPAATEKLWRQLVRRQGLRTFSATADCRPLRAVFYSPLDWMRLATKVAADGSPCAQYYISVPPVVDKTQPRGDQAWRIRALGPNFHAMAEISMSAWASWVSTSGASWYDAGVEARRRMAAAGYDVAAGDTWAVNEFSSAVRRGDGDSRADAREFVRGLYTGDGSAPTSRGAVFITGMSQATAELSVYQARLQDWLEDGPFWTDMSKYVSDWAQEVYGDVRNYAVPGASLVARRDALNEYLQHELALARVGPAAAAAARSFLESAYSPLANAAWRHSSGFGWTDVLYDQMQHYVSAQTYALRHVGDNAGFAWSPKNSTGMDAAQFASETGQILDRLAAAIRDSAAAVDSADPGVGACGPFGENLWCGTDLDGAWFNAGWQSFAAWKPSLLAFTTAPQALTAGTASAAMTLELRAYSGIPLTATSPLTVRLGSSSATGRFSTAASGPWAATLEVAIAAGSASTSFYYLDTTAGTPLVTASADGKQSGTQQQTVAAAALAKVVVAPSSAALQPGASQAFTVSGADAYGNPVPVDDAAWTATAGTVAPATGSSTVFTAGSAKGTGSVVATVGGLAGKATVTVGDVVAPSAPPSLRADALGAPPRVRLTWGAASDDIGVAGYRIYRNGSLIASTTSLSYTDSSVTRSTWYRYDVRAYDAAANVGPASSVSVKTAKR